MIEHFGAAALILVAAAAFFGGLVALAGQLAQIRLALAHRAAAVTVGFLLAGRRPVGDLSHRLHRRGHPRLDRADAARKRERSEEHPSELQSLMRISYAVFCMK